MRQDEKAEEFERFLVAVERRLRHALVARYGHERGREATAEALAWAWQHWDRIGSLERPVAYLYRVGQSRTRGRLKRVLVERETSGEINFEPALASALRSLSSRQRIAVLLVDGSDWTLSEVGELLGVTPSTVQYHVERGRQRLRQQLKVGEHERS